MLTKMKLKEFFLQIIKMSASYSRERLYDGQIEMVDEVRSQLSIFYIDYAT